MWFLRCWVISYVAVGIASRSGFMGEVVNVVCLGCQPRGCCLGKGGAVFIFFRVGALFLWQVSIAALPLGMVIISNSSTHAGFQSMLNDIERMGVSSSSGLVMSSLFGTSPFSTCQESCVVVRVSSFHLSTR